MREEESGGRREVTRVAGLTSGLNVLLFELCRRSRFVVTMEEDWLWLKVLPSLFLTFHLLPHDSRSVQDECVSYQHGDAGTLRRGERRENELASRLSNMILSLSVSSSALSFSLARFHSQPPRLRPPPSPPLLLPLSSSTLSPRPRPLRPTHRARFPLLQFLDRFSLSRFEQETSEVGEWQRAGREGVEYRRMCQKEGKWGSWTNGK
eukprot:634585-Hanusia_phi.AAC.1